VYRARTHLLRVNAPTEACPLSQASHDQNGFICYLDDGWYVESRDGEFGPFPDLGAAENFLGRLAITQSAAHRA